MQAAKSCWLRRTRLAMPHWLAFIVRQLQLSFQCAFALVISYRSGLFARQPPKGQATRSWSCLPYATCLTASDRLGSR